MDVTDGTQRASRRLLLALLSFAALHTLWVLIGAPAGAHRALVANLMFLPVYALAAFLTLNAARARHKQYRRAWLFISAGLFIWTAAQIVYTYLDVTRDGDIFPNVADLGFIALAPLCSIGVLHYSDRSLSRRQVTTFALDVLIVTVTAFGILVDTGLTGARQMDSLHALALTAYSITDVFLIATLLVMALWHPLHPARNFVGVLALALIMLVATHIGMGPLLHAGLYDAGHPVDALWTWSAVLLGVAAYRSLSGAHGSVRPLPRLPHQRRALPTARLLNHLPLVAIVIGFTRVITQRVTEGTPLFSEWTTMAVAGLVMVRLFVSEHLNRDLNEQLREQAYRDTLTTLPNRAALHASLPVLIDHAVKHDVLLAVMFVDLDRFKPVNDLLGHAVGDVVLREACLRVAHAAPTEALVTRVGGDELVVVLPAMTRIEEASVVAERILGALSRPFVAEGHAVSLSASVGLCVVPVDTREPERALSCADLAMYQAKQHGKNTYRFYNPELHAQTHEHFRILAYLREAVTNAEFELAYQPVVDLPTRRVVAFEALIRWRHAVLGEVPPDRFIPVAEENGLINAIGDWVLREAARQMRAWRDAGFADVLVSLNVSSVQFLQPDFTRRVKGILTERGLPGACVILELTESALIRNVQATNEKLAELRAFGVRVALDDFGTGYSSLSYLQRLDVDSVKVDQSFIRSPDWKSGALVRAVAGLARELGLKVIAEGVEDAAQLGQVVRYGFDSVQGYHFSKPLTADEAGALLADQARAAGVTDAS